MADNNLLIYRLAELMLEQEQHILPVDFLFDNSWIGDFVKSIQIDSPYQQMLLEGVITESVRDEKLYVSFTVEGYFHFVLGEVIFEQSKNSDHQFLIHLLQNNRLNGVKEGVELCLIKEVTQGKLGRLVALIDEGGTAEDVARYPLVHAFIKNKVNDVFNFLMQEPSVHDWNVLKHVREILMSYQKQEVVEELDGIIKESSQLKKSIKELLESKNAIEFSGALTLISFYSDLNALDQAKDYYNRFIEEAEKRNNQDALVEALEQLGDSEYKRSGHDGYKAAMAALVRAAEIREGEKIPQKEKLKKTYRLLGSAYKSLGLQVIKSTEYFEKTKAIMLEESKDSAELAEINLNLGIVNFWRGLRGIGRWGNADPSLLEGLDVDLFEYADAQFQEAFDYNFKHLGKTHPQTFITLHYLLENHYTMGVYEQAIPWLRKYVDALPFKTKDHKDNFYRYLLIVSLEESAKQIAQEDQIRALKFINEAFVLCLKYDENEQISNRLSIVKNQIENRVIETLKFSSIDNLPPLEIESKYTGIWNKWEFSDELTGFQTNNWLTDSNGVWFFNAEKRALVFWDKNENNLTTFQPTQWPDGCGRIVYDNSNKKFYAWSSIRSTVYELKTPKACWSRLSYGVHDVHACGASYAFDPVKKRLFEFGGYGFFTHKNWLWVYDLNERKWTQLKENKPGISPYPRNGQLLPIENGTRAILLSGIGSDTGSQREHKARLGLAWATDVGYFTWLRDAHELDISSMNWKSILPSNHKSIRHEGSMGYIDSLGVIINWGGTIPSPIFGIEAKHQNIMTYWSVFDENQFKQIDFQGEVPPFIGGTFNSIIGSNELLLNHRDGIWKLSLHER